MKSRLPIIPAALVTSRKELLEHLAFARTVGNSIHLDVMDGKFCQGEALPVEEWPEIDIEYAEAHLMVENPESYLERLAAKKITRAVVHIESDFDVVTLTNKARELDILIGFAVNPDTDLDELRPFYPYSNYIQLMGITPGATGRTMIDTTPLAVAYLYRLPGLRLTLSVDGGVNKETAPKLFSAGADYCVSSSGIFEHDGNWAENYQELVKAAA